MLRTLKVETTIYYLHLKLLFLIMADMETPRWTCWGFHVQTGLFNINLDILASTTTSLKYFPLVYFLFVD